MKKTLVAVVFQVDGDRHGATAETGTQYGGAAKKVIRDRAISVSDEVSL